MRTFLVAAALLAFAHPLFAAADPALSRLEKSPRHQEWVAVKSGDRTVRAFVVYPEVKAKAAAVLVIHENKGLTDWVRSAADQFAELGYIAIAPDLIGNTSELGQDAATKEIYALPADQVTADLNAAADYAAALPAASGKVVVAGFCWGGMQAFRFATNRPGLPAALVFYGKAPDDAAALANIRGKVFGFYGGNDARVSATVPKTQELMKLAGKDYQPVIYEGARHGFMRAGEAADANDADKKARAEAWARLKAILEKL